MADLALHIPPHQQEVFTATEWKEGNVGITKKQNYNNLFQMLYRIVYTDKRLLDPKSSPVKNSSKTQQIQGVQELTMGTPPLAVDPDPATSETKLCVFSNLASVQAARSDNPCMNISYDCEYQSANERTRVIVSYQFAVYLDDFRILEVCFITKRFTVGNRLYLRTCIGAILDLLSKNFGREYVNYAYNITRRYNVSYYEVSNNEQRKLCETFYNEEDARAFCNIENPLIIVDENINKRNDFKETKNVAFNISIVCHTGIVDLTAFKDDIFGFHRKSGNIMPYLKSVQGGMVSFDPYFTNIPMASEYWKFYPVNLLFRDTMCCAPADGKSLKVLGKCIDVPKIDLPVGAIENMQTYLQTNQDDFLAYAVQDALITLMYGSRLWGINKEWCVTATSGSAHAMKDGICKYLNIPLNKQGVPDNAEFDNIYRGMKKVKKGMISKPCGLRPVSATEPLNYEAKQLHDFSANSYCGGYNTCSISGVYQGIRTNDFDLKNAYPTAMCLVMDIDWDKPFERIFQNEDLSLQAFHTPVDPMFCLVDFEFPESVKYPCIAIHDEGSIIFPRKAECVYVSGPSLYIGLKLGASIHIRYGYVARILLNGLGPSMSLRAATKQMVADRDLCQKTYKKGSIEELLLKLFVNGSYGKIAQNVIEKNTWDGWNESMDKIGASGITSPERAALITDIARCMLIGTMNQLAERGINTYSVTTDGFITEATISELNDCDCYGLKSYMENARLWLTDNTDQSLWALKHDQTELINPTTRCNIGFGKSEIGKRVLAHGGFVTGLAKDSNEDRHEMAHVILTRTGRVECTVTEFVNQQIIQKTGCDFYTFKSTSRKKLDFDLKRKPSRDSFIEVSGTIDGIEYNCVNFDTEPFETIEEYQQYRQAAKSFDRLWTKEDWGRFYLKLEDRENGYKRVTTDMEWNRLFSVIQGFRFGLWDLPELTQAESIKEKLEIINSHNHSNRTFNESSWKNSRKPQRASQMLGKEHLTDLLEEFNYIDFHE